MDELKKAGVELVVEGLSSFTKNMGKAGSALDMLRPKQTLLQKGFDGLFNAVGNFGASIIRVAEVALGVLLRDAMNAAIQLVRDLVAATIDAGNEFQTLEIRLKRLNFNAMVESGMEMNEAMEQSIDLTKEQFKWLQLLAATSPYDMTDVANTLTLARSYGFVDQEARGLTEDILNFAAGMGLGNVEIERIITNFGQLRQQGKLNAMELRDLARGAFVPVNDVLALMAENMGVTTEELDKMRKSGELTTDQVDMFRQAFQELVGERFAGATEDMSQTFRAATDNVLDLVKGIFGLNTVKPILDTLGKRAAAFADSFTDDPAKWDKLVGAAQRLGTALSNVASALLDLLPSTGDLTDKLIYGIESLATWIEEHQDDIVAFFMEVGRTIREDIIPWIRDELVPALVNMVTWIIDNKDIFLKVFETFGEVLSEVGPILAEDILPAISDLLDWISENKEEIIKWVGWIVKAFIAWQVIATVLNVVIGILISVIGFVLGLVSVLTTVFTVISFLLSPAFWGVVAGIAMVIAAIIQIRFWILYITDLFEYWGNIIDEWRAIVETNVMNVINAFRNRDWPGVGRAIVEGVANGIRWFASTIVNAARDAAYMAFDAAKRALGIGSPSKLFFEIGANTMEGMALGIQKAAGLAANSMVGAMSMVASQAAPSMTTVNQVTTTNNMNLNIQSSANAEPIMQDFEMMRSLVGA